MLKPSDNWLDVAKTIIRKSKGAILDISDSTSNVFAELDMLQSEKKDVLITCESGCGLSNKLLSYEILYYSFESDRDEYGKFVDRLSQWIDFTFRIKSQELNQTNLFETARKLMADEHYSSCIVSAYSEFELLIKKKATLEKTITRKLDILKLDSPDSYNDLRRIRDLRNRIIHEAYVATRIEAENALLILENIAKRNSI